MPRKRTYGDSCRLAHALDLVGERWALLVVRELLLGPKRFTDLRQGLPSASTNILADRLRELEAGGVVRRRKLPPPSGASVYELTEWGRDLEPIVSSLGAWGARAPRPPDSRRLGTDSSVLALRSLFDPEAAEGVSLCVELRIDGEEFHVSVVDGEIELSRGPAAARDAAIETDPGTMAAVLTRQLPLGKAIEGGALRIEGGRRTVARFLRLFPMPATAGESAEPELAGAA